MTAYGTSFLSEYRNVVAITSAWGNQTNNTMLWSETVRLDSQHVSHGQVLYEWICRDAQDAWKQYVWKCNVGAASQNASNWTIHYHQIDYCLAQATQPRCKLQFSIQILATVIVMNVCKFICMFLTLWRQRAATLVTIGDAMSSFLDQPDSLTKNRCLMGRIDLNRGPLHWKTFSKDGTTTRRPNTNPERVTFRAPLRRRWFAAASIRRWCLTIGVCLIALSVAGKLLHTGALNLENKTSASIFETGFGAVDSRALITTNLLQGDFAGLGSAVLLANMPQAVMSFLYLTYNGLFTCMCLAQEYSQYGLVKDRKKPLRVTTQHGQQRKPLSLSMSIWRHTNISQAQLTTCSFHFDTPCHSWSRQQHCIGLFHRASSLSRSTQQITRARVALKTSLKSATRAFRFYCPFFSARQCFLPPSVAALGSLRATYPLQDRVVLP